jgi:Uma2 family endonuclease
MTVRQKMTVADYLALPEVKPYLEYIDGEAVQKSMPDSQHTDLAEASIVPLSIWASGEGRVGPEGRVEYETARGTEFRLADVAYWPKSRPRHGVHAMLPPLLAIEIRSPDDTMAERRAKCRFYREHGVEVAWLIDANSRTVEVFEGTDDPRVLREGDVLTSPSLPGFELPLAQLFSVLDE